MLAAGPHEQWVGLVLKLKERNLSTRTRLPDSVWRFLEECPRFAANESGQSDSIYFAKAPGSSDQRELTNGLKQNLAQG